MNEVLDRESEQGTSFYKGVKSLITEIGFVSKEKSDEDMQAQDFWFDDVDEMDLPMDDNENEDYREFLINKMKINIV